MESATENSGCREILSSSLAQHGSFEDVLPHIFENLDVKRLKICRLVSKRWNEEACRVLRKRCISCANVCSKNYETGFVELLKYRNQDLPLPFRVLHVYLAEMVLGDGYKIIGDILGNLDGEVRKLRVGPIYSSNMPSELHPILQTHSSTLTHLFIDHHQRVEIGLTYHREAKFDLPFLESLSFSVSPSWEAGLKNLLLTVISGAPKLTHVTIDYSRKCEEGHSLLELMTLQNFTKIQSLSVDVFMNKEGAEDLLLGLENLKDLKMLSIGSRRGWGCISLDEDMMFNLLRALCTFSSSIQYLDLSSLRLDPDDMEEGFPLCPSLISLSLFEVDFGHAYFERSPALKKLAFYRCYFESDLTLDKDTSYPLIDTIEFFNMHDFLSHCEWNLLLRMVPNCQNLKMSTSFGLCYCNAVVKNEVSSPLYSWNLNSITLDNGISAVAGPRERDEMFVLLTGIKKDRWQFAVNNGLDPERIRINASLLDLKGLSSLKVKNYEITNAVIELGLGRMKTLKSLETELSESVCTEKARKALQHLTEIVVTNCCGFPSAHGKQTQMERLFAKMPTARCGCKIKGYAP